MRGHPTETFVDRIVELGVLQALLDDARRGTPRVALIVGASGLGKTSLVRRLARVAGEQGATVLHAACQEGLNVPYLPVATALRTLDVQLADDLAPAGAPPPGDAAAGSPLRLFVEATEAIRRACRAGPVVLVVDDVQWADAATVELLSHLSASLLLSASGAPHGVLLVLAHRPAPAPAVRRLLERLRRHPAAAEVALAPFAEAEGHALVAALAGVRARADTLARLLERTGGNPLLLRGLVERSLEERRLVVEGRNLVIAGDRPLTSARTDLDLDAEDRIARLSARCRSVAGVAAFVAAEGPVAVLAEVLGSDPTAALAEAAAEGILVVDGERYRFELDEVRRHLAARAAAGDVAALHERVVDALEVTLGPAAPPGLVLAHLLEVPGVGSDRRRTWAWRAGEAAQAAGAWRDALDAYLHVLRATPEPDRTADLLLRVGVAAFRANDVDVARAHLDAAIAAARAAGDLACWSAATLTKVRLAFVGASAPADDAELDELLVATEAVPALHATGLTTAADLAYARQDFDRSSRLALAAIDADRSVGGRSPLPSFSHGVALLGALELEPAARRFEEARALAAAAGDDHVRTGAVSRRLLVALLRGRLREIDETAPTLVAEMQHRGYWADAQVAMCTQVQGDALAGRFARAEQGSQLTELLVDWLPYAFTAAMLLPAQAAIRVRRGDVAGARRSLTQWADLGGRGVWRFQQLVDALGGDLDGVRHQLSRRAWPAPAPAADLFTLGVLVAQVEVGAAVGDAATVEPALAPLRDALERGVRYSAGWPASLARVVGTGEAALGQVDGARSWLEIGVEHTADAGATAELALAQAALAAAGLAAGLGGAARQLTAAADLLDELGMLPAAAEARQLAGSRRRTRPRRRVVFCSDLVGSTQMNVRAGDAAYVEVLKEHDRILRRLLAAHDGVEFKHTGDGMFAWFALADDALRCAVEVHSELERWSACHAELPLVARVGLAEGDPVDHGQDLFGITVVLASRLCGIAGAGRTVATAEVRASTSSAPVTFVSLGDRTLKGFGTGQEVFEVLAIPNR